MSETDWIKSTISSKTSRGKRTAQKDTIIDTTSDSQVNSIFPRRRSPASLTFNNYFYLFLYLYITRITINNNNKITTISPRSHPRHLVRKMTAQKETITDTTSDSQVNSNFPYKWSPASPTFNNYLYPCFIYDKKLEAYPRTGKWWLRIYGGSNYSQFLCWVSDMQYLNPYDFC